MASHPEGALRRAVCVRFNRAVSPPVGLSRREHVWSRGVLRGFVGLANTTATLGSFYWLGFETSGLSPDKKRLAWLGARKARAPLSARAHVDHTVRVVLVVIETERLIGVVTARLVASYS